MLASVPVPTDDLVRVRRRLHRNPELSMEEHETAAFVTAELSQFSLDDLRVGVGRTGVLGTLRGGKSGPVTLLRADMDALPIAEAGAAEYRSQRSGAMHACGHDGHVSMLLAAGRTLAERRNEVPGTLVFCFQPGEEGHAGNRLMIEDGALENPYVDRTFALHLYSGLDVGKIGVRDGAFFASADEFALIVRGRGGHGAMPHLAADPVMAGAYLVTMLQTIVSREVAPKDPAVFTIGAFNAGTTFNVIPDEATLHGTVRCFDAEVRASMPERLKRIAGGLGEALRVECDVQYRWSYPPTVNDTAVNDIVREVGAAVLGRDNVVEHDIVMWAEDMSFMQEQRPGAYFIVGSRGGPSSAYPHHNARFDIDERALDIGYRMLVALGLRG
ncbi:MAG: amidohydrolase [Candidatus Eremiobacteraeota bacterium]|nr:amidohydrolase [Candidatus Eremiobacteraeota bacterium]MBC5802899.1 amidohydrolase [Candidatus Eremiobacteraeota bacterium]MBC5821160.1 amidohydrolase [Candidatus Eremiobacteraeota bacterium]